MYSIYYVHGPAAGRPAVLEAVRRVTEEQAGNRGEGYHNMLGVNDTAFKADSMSYLRVLHLVPPPPRYVRRAWSFPDRPPTKRLAFSTQTLETRPSYLQTHRIQTGKADRAGYFLPCPARVSADWMVA
jgi:hypothetical protein